MAFLFKSKKHQHSQQAAAAALPPATRNVHTSEGAPPAGSPTMANGVKGDGTNSQTPTPSGSFSNSLRSAASPTSPDAVRPRQRAESESQVGICFAIHSLFDEDIALMSTTDATTPATAQRDPPSKPRFIPLPMVATPLELLFSPDEPISSVWSSNQFGGIKGRRHIHDGRPDRWINRQG